MAAEYREITENEEPRVIARELIQAYHGHLVEARIAYLWREGKWASKGVTTLGKAYKLSGHNEYLSEKDFVVVLNHDVWKGMSPDQRRALVDHELTHCGCAEDSEGNRTWCISLHDLEEFVQIVRRHGLWHPEGPRFKQAIREYEQLPLDLVPPGVTAVSFGTPEDFKAGRQVTFTREEAAEIGAIPSSTAIMADYLNKKVAATRPVQERVAESPPSGLEPAGQAVIPGTEQRICFGSEPDELCAKGYTEDNGENIPPCPRLADCRAAWDAYEAEHSAEPEEAPAQPAELPTNDDTRITPAQAERMSEVMGLVEMYGAQQVEAALSRPPLAYREPDGAIITVRQGLGDDWGSFRAAASGKGHHRVKSARLPMRQTREEAEVDLIAWAEGRGLERVDLETGEVTAPARTPTEGRQTVTLTIEGEEIEYVEVWRSAVAGTRVAMLEATSRRPSHDHDAIAVEITDNAGEPYVRITHKELADRVCDAYHLAFTTKKKTA